MEHLKALTHTTRAENLEAILKSGCLLTQQEQLSLTGVVSNGLDMNKDKIVDGVLRAYQTNGVYLRPQFGRDFSFSDAVFVFHSSILAQRKDWYANTHDAYGRVPSFEKSYKPHQLKEFTTCGKYAHEVCFRSFIPLIDACEIVVKSRTLLSLVQSYGYSCRLDDGGIIPFSQLVIRYDQEVCWKGLPELPESVTSIPSKEWFDVTIPEAAITAKRSARFNRER